MNQSDIELVRQPIPNMDKIYAVLDQIEADPEHWEQAVWANECGTVCCFAGWACKLEGMEFGNYGLVGDDQRAISVVATEILGLTSRESYNLFVDTIKYPDSANTDERKEHILGRVKIEVAKISARAKEQQAAFERVAKELIESVPELEAVIQPGYLCPESQALVLGALGGQDGGN